MKFVFTIPLCCFAATLCVAADYFPPPDSSGGWRVKRDAGMDTAQLDAAFEFAQRNTKNGGLLVVRNGWLVYERYFGRGNREALPNTASCGKSFTSIAAGIMLARYPKMFPDGLDQKIWTPAYLPPEAFPPTDPLKLEIRLGQLLAMTGGIRGNNPSRVNGKEITLEPAGPDGISAMLDDMALGLVDAPLNTKRLWCKPGEGYSYATASAHLASMVVRKVTGMELQQFVEQNLAKPMGWGRFEWGYGPRPHTPGGGGIAPRATDMLRFAYMLLHEGRWGDQQVVPADYVRQCARPTRFNPHSLYSLMFDVNADRHAAGVPRDAYWKQGSGGHCFYIVPSLDLVVWKLGGRDEQYGPGAPDATRANWKVSLGNDEAVVQTIRAVVQAIH